MTNNNMTPGNSPTHLLKILISVDGNTESLYRLPIT